MKRIIKCIIFIIIFLIILVILSKIFIPKNNTLEAGLGKRKLTASGIYTEPENTIDVLVLGDSESYTSYIPLELWNQYGFTSYVCGTPAQRLSVSLSYIKDALKTQKPKIVLLEADNTYIRISKTKHLKDDIRGFIPAFEYHDRWKNLNLEDFYKSPEYTNIINDKGYRYSNIIEKVKKSKQKKYMKKTKNILEISNENKNYLRKIKKCCDENNIKFMLYSSPDPANWTYDKQNGTKKFAKELGIEYIDLNLKVNEMQIDWKNDSQDKKGEHLNYTGALKVTNYLGNYLKEHNELPDHRQDEKYSLWNEAYNNFQKEIEESKKASV